MLPVQLPFIIVAFLQNATIEYSLESLCASVCECVFVRVCFCVCVFLQITRKEIVVNENNSDKFDIVHCGTKVKVFFLHLLQYNFSGPITQLWYKLFTATLCKYISINK